MIKKERFKIPTDKTKMLAENIERIKMSESKINPSIKEGFDLQQSKNFNKSVTWPSWYMNLKKFLYEKTDLLDNWKSDMDESFHDYFLLGLTVEDAYDRYLRENVKRKRFNL